MEDLKKQIEIIKQTQDDINGYLDSLTTDIDFLRAKYEELSSSIVPLESQGHIFDEVKNLRNDVNMLLEKFEKG